MNPDKTEAIRMAEVAESFFSQHGIRTVRITNQKEDLSGADLILTFGGDGTFLIGARIAMEHDIPLMGINLGTVGFLTEEEPEHLTECLQTILNGEFQIDRKSQRIESSAVLLVYCSSDLFQSDPAYAADRPGKILPDHLFADPDRLKDLAALVGLYG